MGPQQHRDALHNWATTSCAVEIFERGLGIARAQDRCTCRAASSRSTWPRYGSPWENSITRGCLPGGPSPAVSRGDLLTVAGALKCRARIERERGAYDASIATLRIAIFEAEGLEDRLLQREMMREFGQTSRALGNPSEARLAWREAAESFEDVGARHEGGRNQRTARSPSRLDLTLHLA